MDDQIEKIEQEKKLGFFQKIWLFFMNFEEKANNDPASLSHYGLARWTVRNYPEADQYAVKKNIYKKIAIGIIIFPFAAVIVISILSLVFKVQFN